jgi:hypothetical protein
MDSDGDSPKELNSIEEVVIRSKVLTDALYEVLADKGVLTGDQVIERIKNLKSEIKANLSRPN